MSSWVYLNVMLKLGLRIMKFKILVKNLKKKQSERKEQLNLKFEIKYILDQVMPYWLGLFYSGLINCFSLSLTRMYKHPFSVFTAANPTKAMSIAAPPAAMRR